MKKLILSICIIGFMTNVSAQQILPQTFGKGILNVVSKDSSWCMKLGARFQTLYVGEIGINDTTGFGVGTNEVLIRRARLKFDGYAVSPKLKYKLELGLSNRDIGRVDTRNNSAPNIIMDAVVMWNFAGNFELWAGQTKLPGNRERVVSSSNMQFVDRSLLNNAYNIDRDIGLQLRHDFKLGKNFVVKEILAASQGEGRNVVQQNFGGLEYTARIEFLPFGEFKSKGDYVMSDVNREATPKLALGFTYDYNDRAVKDRGNQGSYMMYDRDGDKTKESYFHSNISTIFADLMFKWKGFSLMGEYALRSADVIMPTEISDNGDTLSSLVQAGSGLNICGGYLFKSNWELAARYTSITPHALVGQNSTHQFGLGVSRYVVEHALKVQVDVNYLMVDNSPDKQLMYRLQIEIHF